MSFQALNLINFECKDGNMINVKFEKISPILKKVYTSIYARIENNAEFSAAIEAYLQGHSKNEEAGEEQ